MKTANEIEKKVFSYIEEHHMLETGDLVVAGVSGGADSVCLLFVLLSYAKIHPIKIAVVHMDHKIRQESGEDADFVRRLCEENNLPFYLYEKQINDMAVEMKCSTEEAGRMARYQAFSEVADKLSKEMTDSEKKAKVKIAIAHNKNDTCETMLFHLFRGSGLKGLCGILPVRDQLIRPLLCLQRSEIETYLSEMGVSYCTDATNAEDDYTRNRIRHNILPYAEDMICNGAVDHIAKTAEQMSQLEDYLMRQTMEAVKGCAQFEENERIHVDVKAFHEQHPVIKSRMLLELMKEATGVSKDLSSVHVEALLTLFEGETGRSLNLPYNLLAIRQYDEVILKKAFEDGDDKETADKEVADNRKDEVLLEKELLKSAFEKKEEVTLWIREDLKCVLSVFSYENSMEVSQNQYTKWFDYDKIKSTLSFRGRKSGDRLSIKGSGESVIHKKVKDYLINEKITREQRDSLLVLAEGSDILWIVGYRMAETYKITEETKQVLQVQLIQV